MPQKKKKFMTRRRNRDLTRMLEERQKVFEKIYRPRKVTNVEEVIKKYRSNRDRAFSSKYGKSILPSITPRSRRSGKISRLRREDSVESDFASEDYDDNFEDENSNSEQTWDGDDNLNSEHIIGDSTYIGEPESLSRHTSLDESEIIRTEVNNNEVDSETYETYTQDNNEDKSDNLRIESTLPFEEENQQIYQDQNEADDIQNETIIPSKPSSAISQTSAGSKQAEPNVPLVNIDCTSENDEDEKRPVTRRSTTQTQNLTPNAGECELRDHDGSELSEIGKLVERERSNVKPKVPAKPTFDFRSEPLVLTKDTEVKSKMLSDEEVQKMMETTDMFKGLKTEVKENTQKVNEFFKSSDQMNENMQTLRKTLGTCQLIWKITDFKQKYQDAKSGQKTVLYSPAFETHPYGYKMAVTLVPNGDGKGQGKHMSIFFTIMQGKWDGILTWPFSHPLTFTLLDQSEEETVKDISARFVPNPVADNMIFLGKPESYRNPSLGLPQFAPLSAVWSNNGRKYVKDDTLFIKVEVDVKGEDHDGYIATEGEIIRGEEFSQNKLRY